MAPSEVLIAGAGPTGLAAALFLARRGIRPRIVDAAPAPAETSRALAVNPRTLELLEESGVADRILAEGRSLDRVQFYDDWKPIAALDLRSAHPRYRMTALSQARTEALLTEALEAESVVVERGVALSDITRINGEVESRLRRGEGPEEAVSASILFAADGARSRARRCLDLGFEGTAFPEEWLLYDLRLDLGLGLDAGHACFTEDGLIFLIAPRPGLWRVFGNVADPLSHLPPGTEVGEVIWHSTFHIAHRVVSRAVVGRVAFGGDAAHIHSPMGARGMNLGIEDAYVFAACAADALAGKVDRLADYGRLRLPIHRDVVRRIELLTRLARGRPGAMAVLRRLVIPMVTALPALARQMRSAITGLDHDIRTA